MRPVSRLALPLAVLALFLGGCARRVPVSELDARGADVGVRLVLESGGRVDGRLASLTPEAVVVDALYSEGAGVVFESTGERLRVIADGARVDGEVLSVEGRRPRRVATLRLTFAVADVREATFHQSAREARLGPIVSLLLGPLVGASLALLL